MCRPVFRSLRGEQHGQNGLDLNLTNLELVAGMKYYLCSLRGLLREVREVKIRPDRGPNPVVNAQIERWAASWRLVEPPTLELGLLRGCMAATEDIEFLERILNGEIDPRGGILSRRTHHTGSPLRAAGSGEEQRPNQRTEGPGRSNEGPVEGRFGGHFDGNELILDYLTFVIPRTE
ncbi:hypothetical protein EJ05DRAFT_361045 [Pseudovirgaria hyperparasitica]|uniref:Uncharacterized protein n=1 Tax=Pseudovirgaria hyperparasitica TaxID=470096 RepID=A0A6A6W9P4_9PEZI|nr:uncharacterized protein EJ05DRAFT_361045 [Pseudovirgaria hyperparasitica]KAF2758670.1 hypothetical protein EJ05DRAFT_361045 [Pseudovirgaria hyperparasitica]